MSSKSDHYVHIIWATKRREMLVTSDIERDLYRCISNEVEKQKCKVCAINGMPDHVHMVVSLHPDASTSQLMKRAKGVSAALANDLRDHQQRFRWQESYYVRSISLSHLKRVLAYVRNQKQHHADGTLYSSWEDTGEDEDS